MDVFIGLEAIDEAQTQVLNSQNTLSQTLRFVPKGIEIMIINTYNGDIITEVIPNNRINFIEGEICKITKFEILSFLDAYTISLDDDSLMNMGWICRLDLLSNVEKFLIKRF